MLVRFYLEYTRITVKHHYVDLMTDRRVIRKHILSIQTYRVDAAGETGLLKYPHVHVGMIHTTQVGPQADIASVTYVIKPDTDQHPILV